MAPSVPAAMAVVKRQSKQTNARYAMQSQLTPLQAKFEREKKEKPIDWIIKPIGRGYCELVYIGRPDDRPSKN